MGPVRARWDPMRKHWARAFGRLVEKWPEGPIGYPIARGVSVGRGRSQTLPLWNIEPGNSRIPFIIEIQRISIAILNSQLKNGGRNRSLHHFFYSRLVNPTALPRMRMLPWSSKVNTMGG